jgi:hypothetical protein
VAELAPVLIVHPLGAAGKFVEAMPDGEVAVMVKDPVPPVAK